MTDYPFLSHFLFKVYQQSVIMKTVFNAIDGHFRAARFGEERDLCHLQTEPAWLLLAKTGWHDQLPALRDERPAISVAMERREIPGISSGYDTHGGWRDESGCWCHPGCRVGASYGSRRSTGTGIWRKPGLG